MSRCEGRDGDCVPATPLEEVLGYETGWKDAVISYPNVDGDGEPKTYEGEGIVPPDGINKTQPIGFTTTTRMTFDILGLYGKLSAIDVLAPPCPFGYMLFNM